MIRKLGVFIGLAILALLVVIGVNTLRFKPAAIAQVEAPLIAVDAEKLAAELGESIRFRTMAPADKRLEEFTGFVNWLEVTYPNVHRTMDRTLINDLTPFLRWEGKDPSLAPVLLTGHYDVVPALEGGTSRWTHPPFGGVIADGYVWGRGTLDDKGAILTMMTAAETLIADGFQPERTIYFSFGHDEETSGYQGAGGVVDYMQAQGLEFEWSLDEGSMVLRGMVPGMENDVASINVAEKGYLTLDLTAKAEGGHSSLPPRETAVGVLSAGVAKLQAQPFPGGLTDVSADFFTGMGPHFGLPERIVFANQWLFKPLLESQLSGSTGTDAMLRTTIAPTMLLGSSTENVLPQEAVATVNFRIHPRDTVESVMAYVADTIDDDRIEISMRGNGRGASPVSSADTEGFALLSQSFSAVFEGVAIVPGLTLAATDSAHYVKVAKNSYRINPFVFEEEDLPRIHGKNERISLQNLEKGVQFYALVMQGS